MNYVLEVRKFHPAKYSSDFELSYTTDHVGYMNILFLSKHDACDYYDRHNKHMRLLNADETWVSDRDPDTKLLYVVREYKDENRQIPPFNPKHASKLYITYMPDCVGSGRRRIFLDL